MPGGCHAPETWVGPGAGMQGTVPSGRGGPVGLQHPARSNTMIFLAKSPRQLQALHLRGNETGTLFSRPYSCRETSHHRSEQVPPFCMAMVARPRRSRAGAPRWGSPGSVGAVVAILLPSSLEPILLAAGLGAGCGTGPTALEKQVFPTPLGKQQGGEGKMEPFSSVGFRHKRGKPSSPLGQGRGQPGVPRTSAGWCLSLNPAGVAGAGSGVQHPTLGAMRWGEQGCGSLHHPSRALGPPWGCPEAPGAMPPLVLFQLAGAGSVSGISRTPD